MSYDEDQGTAAPRPVEGAVGGNVRLTSGFLQVMPEEFTREELRALISKARALAQYGIFDDTKRDLLVDLVETLDLLDALAARDDLDLAGCTCPPGVTITNVPCCPSCPYFND